MEKTVQGGIAKGYGGIPIVIIISNIDDYRFPDICRRNIWRTVVYGRDGVFPTYTAFTLGRVPEQVLQG